MTPSFSATLFQWFEAGGLVAIPNLRGGGEYGEAWHAAGSRGQKQHAFDDAVAAAEWLIANRYTSVDKLAMYGGATGALVAGAVVTQRPDLLRAAVMFAPVLDMVRYQYFGAGSTWIPEYGSAEVASEVPWLAAYSPYQRITAHTAYPAVLITALERGAPVHAMHARKMTAALQAATSSDQASRPILFREDLDSGEDPGAGLDLKLRDIVDARIFLMWQLGVK
jgi:prolyl oligopeptidase